MTIWLKNLTTNILDKVENIKISSFIPSGLFGLVKDVPDNHYILGVQYITGECQICISGHPKGGETLFEGGSREMNEELNLIPTKLTWHSRRGVNNFFSCLLDFTRDSMRREINPIRDSQKRVVISVHGDEENIVNYLSRVHYRTCNEDKIIGIWASDRETIINFLNSRRETGSNILVK